MPWFCLVLVLNLLSTLKNKKTTFLYLNYSLKHTASLKMPKGNLQNLISEILKNLLCQIFPYFLLTYPNTWAIYIFNISISEQKKGKNIFSVNNPTKQKYVFPHSCEGKKKRWNNSSKKLLKYFELFLCKNRSPKFA